MITHEGARQHAHEDAVGVCQVQCMGVHALGEHPVHLPGRMFLACSW
jgi:hypothetical protein